MKNNFNILLGIVAIITILTRFIGLNLIPNNLSNDEISIAWDAYSISKTLKDEHNHFLPLSFQSHDTYKAPLTIYLTIPSTIILGNNEIAARIPSALLGSLTVLFIGLLVFELSKNKYLGLFSSLVLSISPMHILTSRMIYEPNIGLFFFTLGLYLFFLSLRIANFFIIFGSFFAFVLSVYSYHTHWVFTPLIITLLFLIYRKSLYRKSQYIFGVTLFLLLVVPIFSDFLNNLHSTTRASTENILRDPSIIKKLENSNFALWQKLSFMLQIFIDKYSSYFNLSYLFFTGYNFLPKDDPFQLGVFLFVFLPFLFIGIVNIKPFFKEHSKFIYLLFFLSPLTASLTSGPQSTSRNLVSLIPLSIVCSVGILVFWKNVSNIWKKTFMILLAISFLYFLVIFYYHFPKDSGEGFQYGYKQIALFIKPRYHQYSQIIIEQRFGPNNMYSGIPHLYIPYFTNLDPTKIPSGKRTKQYIFFDKYQIRDINWNNEQIKKNTLYVVPVSNLPPAKLNLQQLYDVTLPNLQPAFYIYTLL